MFQFFLFCMFILMLLAGEQQEMVSIFFLSLFEDTKMVFLKKRTAMYFVQGYCSRHALVNFNENMHTCRRSSIAINTRKNIHGSCIYSSSVFTRKKWKKTNFLRTFIERMLTPFLFGITRTVHTILKLYYHNLFWKL